ncbi:MAG: PAS domain-containing protein [Pseudomonadota bacterium]
MPFLGDAQERFQASWLSQMAAAVTVLDPQGHILFYNDYAPSLLDRKPSYLGRPVQELHNASSAAKIDAILAAYRQGRYQVHGWSVHRPDQAFAVQVAPWLEDGQLQGLIHVAVGLPAAPAV